MTPIYTIIWCSHGVSTDDVCEECEQERIDDEEAQWWYDTRPEWWTELRTDGKDED